MPGNIHVPVTVGTKGFEAMQRTFSRLRGVTAGLTVALGGLAAASKAIDFTGAAIQGARDLERNYAGLASVFKNNTEQMKEFGQTASEMGLSMNEAAKATTFIGSVLKQSGFSIQETSDLTEELVELGADLALTYGYDVQEALLGMTALFRGEYDPIEKFGVAMKQSEIDAEKAARGLDGLTGAAERFADQQIRVEFLMDRASDAMGAFDRQSGNLTVQQMRLRAEFENVRDTIADDLLPPLADFTGGLREIVEDVGPDLDRFFDDLAPVLDTFAKQALPLLKGAIEGVIGAFDAVIQILERAQDPSTELGNSMEALGNALDRLFNNVNENGPSAKDTIDGLAKALEFLADSLTVVVDIIDQHGETIFNFLLLLYGGRLAGSAVGKKSLGKQNKELGDLAKKIGGIAAAIALLPKQVAAVGIIGYLLGDAVYGDLDLGGDVDELAGSFENATDSAKDFDRAFANASYLRMNPYGALRNATQDTSEDFTILGKDVKTLGDLFGYTKDEQTPLISSFEGFRDVTFQTAGATADYRDRTIEAYLAQLNLNGALAEFKLLASTAVDTTTLEGVLEASRGKGMGGGPVGWDAEEYLKGLGLITPDGKEDEVSGKVEDFVGDFFGGMQEEIEKQAARLDLEALGLSEALIDQILGASGWDEIFQTIIDGGADMARQLQIDFNQTSAGVQELAERAEALADELKNLRDQEASLNESITAKETERDEALESARDKFYEFKESINLTVYALQTYEREIGRFESQTRSDLGRIEDQINNAFDNGYLLEQARDNLLEYARAELNTLAQLQRQRDQLLSQRNAAADTIFGIADAVTSAGNITQLLQGVQDEVKEVQVSELFEDIVDSADGLNGFKVTLERNYTDVITNTVSKSQALVSGFQDVIDRTRAFIDNLKLLREMGLDPFLFNQLVQAGAEAGGATAQALVEGGADTVNEVNSLQGELEAMGVELGEQTYEVTKNSGEQFVSGIIDGIDAELEDLEESAMKLAAGFSSTFATAMSDGMAQAFEIIRQEIQDMFNELLEELQRQLEELRSQIERQQGYTNPVTVLSADETHASTAVFDPVTGELLRSYTAPVDSDLIGDGMVNPDYFADYQSSMGGGSQAGTTYINNIINANNPLDAYNASKGNVEQQINYQSSNGSIQTTFSGVGS